STEDFVTDAYEIATMIRRRNLEMAFTPGYLREVPYFEERVTKDGRPFYEVHSAIDFQSATLLTTGIPLDLGIQGPGFFQVTDENGQKFFTRRGRFALSQENELVLIDGDRQLWLTPKITINRDDLAGITISPTGHLSYESIEDSLDDADGTERILLVLPVSGWYLEVLANGLFQLSPGHEKELLTIGPGEGAGTIRQGALEVPRFDLDGERSALMDLEQLTRSRN
ncbi:MAG: flagellar hook basal-body protein, partial [Planctomycetaceae bacterium]|nr:flagellar hook basal-body protein [Planctomycetaceae bacterium]